VLLIPVCCTHRLKYSGSAAVLVARWGRSQAGASVAKDRPKKKPSVSLAVVEEEEVEEEEADKGQEEEEPQPEQTSGTKNKRARSETPTACSRKRTLGTQRASRDSDRPQPVQVVVEQTHSITHCEVGRCCIVNGELIVVARHGPRALRPHCCWAVWFRIPKLQLGLMERDTCALYGGDQQF
jgi:hypothetical protein